MQTQLADFLRDTADGDEIQGILSRCVHCGFCTATCPTYQLLNDELDGPRGRIYLIRQMAEGAPVTRSTQQHLDRCLSCRSCETTCPSGVEYGRLLELGRKYVDMKVRRPARERVMRAALTAVVPERQRFAPALALGQLCKPLLPRALKDKIPDKHVPAAASAGQPVWPQTAHLRSMILLEGCVQPVLRGGINPATARVLDKIGIRTLRPVKAGCCGALRLHMNEADAACDDARRNIDAWWPAIEAGAEAIIMNASGCGATVKDYGHLLRNDPAYAQKAVQVAALTRDLSEILYAEREQLYAVAAAGTASTASTSPGPLVAYHPPCTLQHGQQIRDLAETVLRGLGMQVVLPRDSHLCCGSAGTYSILQKELSVALRDRKLAALSHASATAPSAAADGGVIASANIGCITHLQTASQVPVMHWIELVDAHLQK